MKIRKPDTEELKKKVNAIVYRACTNSKHEEKIIEKLRYNKRTIYEWTVLHRNMVIGYILFTKAYKNEEVIGLHLSLIAVHPDFQRQGVGSELIQFALRQKEVKDTPLFTIGKLSFFEKFGFTKCTNPISPLAKKNKNFLVKGNIEPEEFNVGYEPEISA